MSLSTRLLKAPGGDMIPKSEGSPGIRTLALGRLRPYVEPTHTTVRLPVQKNPLSHYT